MNALINAHTHRGRSRSPYVGLTSNVLPEAQCSHTGVSSDYVQKANHEWFVLRVTYNRTQKAHGIISTSDVQSYIPILKYYLDKTKPKEINGKHPPLTIPFSAMINFIKATSTESDHVRIVSNEQCHYKSGDIVKVIDGEFKGVTGRVARITGQQRVVVEIVGLCMVATAYIPSAFLEVK